jgi:membrane-associated phospholipid phosphatase
VRLGSRAVVILLLVGGGARSAQGEEPPQLRYDWEVDGAVTAAALAVWGGTQLFQSRLAPATCRWCQVNSLDSSVRDALVWSDTGAANVASNVGAYAIVPLATVGLTALAAEHDGRLPEMAGNSLVITEAVALSGALNQIVKFAAGRERPFVHALPASEKPLTSNPADNNVSFYSSHTSFAFSLATASGTVASMRKYRLAPLVWAAGMVSAAAVGYLRIAADRHYFTDVLAGAAVGAGIGFAVPSLFHRWRGLLALAPVPGGGAEALVTARW